MGRKELHNKQEYAEKLKSTFEERLLKRENTNNYLAIENSQVKITSNNLKLENVTIKEELLKQKDANKCLKLENLELKERFESKMGTIKKLEEQKLLEIENLKTLEVL